MRPARILLLHLAVFAVISSPLAAYAQTDSDVATKSTVPVNATIFPRGGMPAIVNQAEREERRQNRQEKIREHKVTQTTKRQERKLQLITRFKERIQRLLMLAQKHLDRLNTIFDRVQSRVNKFKDAGKDVSALEPLIADAQKKQTDAQSALKKAQDEFAALNLDQSQTPRVEAQKFMQILKETRLSFQEYRKAIVAIVIKLRGMSMGTKVKPTLPTNNLQATPASSTQ